MSASEPPPAPPPPDSDPPASNEPEAEESVRQVALRGTLWTLMGYGGTQVLRLGSNLVLAYLLFPEAFGVMALVNVFLIGMEMFSDFGVWRSCIQNPRGDDPRFLGTAYTIQAVRGVGLWLCTCLLAWPYAAFYEEPMLVPYLIVLGFSIALRGFESTTVYTLNRAVAVRPLTALDLSARFVQAAVMVGWAYVDPNVWALVAGGVAYSIVRFIGSHLLLGQRTASFAWEPEARAELMRFGKWIIGSSIVMFLTVNADRLILGKLISKEELGIYSIAFGYTSIVAAVVIELADRVLFPILSRAQQQPDRVMGMFVESRRVVLWAAAGLCAAIVFGAPLFFEVIYDDRYLAAGQIAQWLVLYTWATVTVMGLDLVPLAFGRSEQQFFGNLVRSSGLITAIIGFYLADLPGLIAGLSLSAVFGQLYLVAKFPTAQRRVHLQTLRFSLGLGAFIAVCLGGPVAWVSGESLIMRILVAAGLILITMAGAGAVVMRQVRGGRPQP